MNKILKVAMVIGKAIDGGTEAFAMNYYKFIDHTKIEFDFLVESTSKIINPDDVKKYGNGKIIIIPSYEKPIKYVHKLTQIFKNEKYDIVHSNMNTISVLTLKAAKKAGVKIRIAHSHSTANGREFFKTMIKNLLRPFSKLYANYFFACSAQAGAWLFGKGFVKAGRVTIIKDAIQLDRFKFNEEKRESIRRDLSINKDSVVIGNIGRFQPQKNQIFLLSVFKEYHLLHPNSFLLLVGGGPQQETLQCKAKKLMINNWVIFVGNKKDVSPFYSAMDCFVFPSIYEGLGMTLIEAQESGLHCVISNKIPQEAVSCPNIIRKKLTDSPKDWAKSISISRVEDRLENITNLKANGYDIIYEAKILDDLYIRMESEI